MLKAQQTISEIQLKRGLQWVIVDGLTAEAMTTLSGGVFLTALAVLLHATNLEIGILAALPTFTNIFQLLSVWLVRKYTSRKRVTVVSSLLARVPLFVTGLLIWLHPMDISWVILLLFFFYFFGSLAGPSWNAWMKDLVPEEILGTYFSKRTSYTQFCNVLLSLLLALLLDNIKNHHPENIRQTYGIMFSAAGVIGLAGAVFLSKAPEPINILKRENLWTTLSRPLKDKNFLWLLFFNGVWAFALNLSTPFFVVFMLETLKLPLSYIIALSIVSQLCGIVAVRLWGMYADRYSNKTIIAITSPVYIATLIAWCYAGIYTSFLLNLILLILIHIFSGITLSGVNLSVTNIGLKLAPAGESIVYLSVRNIFTALFSATSPLVGGFLADYFVKRHLLIDASWQGPRGTRLLHILSLHEWGFLFLISALIALLSLELLSCVKEKGEVEKTTVVRILRSHLRNQMKDYFIIGNLITLHGQIRSMFRKRTGRPVSREPRI